MSYKRDRDCASLNVIAGQIQGQERARVEALLGPPEYEPTPGQYYYSSTQTDCSLVIDYRKADTLTNTVQNTELGAIGE